MKGLIFVDLVFTIAIIDLLTDDKKRSELSHKARERARMFSWDETVNKTIEVWRTAIYNRKIEGNQNANR